MPQLTIHNAQLTTAKAEMVKLTVDSKQVTLAVFRQLIEEPLVDEDGNLNGVPWGTVNYHPDKCADERDHLHVVWQKGDLLRRSMVRQPRWWATRFYSEWTDDYIQAIYCLNAHKEPSGWRTIRVDGDRCIEFRLDDMDCETLAVPKSKWDLHECLTAEKRDEELEGLREDIATEKLRRRRISDHWKALNDLPQLFIAV
ncbi:MAG: hypothetical protein ACRDOK_27320 [Streptosporangiaceae bacterium]